MTTTPSLTPTVQRSWSGRRTLLVVVGAFFGMVSLILFAIGGFGLWAQQQRDNGYFTAGPERVTTSSYALLAPSLDVGGTGPDALYADDFLGDVRIDVESKNGTPVFVGIGPAAEVAKYLNGVSHDEVADFDVDPFKLSTTAHAGDKPVAAPADQSFWVASGSSTLDWNAVGGDWSVVVMNADGSPNVDAELSLGGTLPAVEGITIGSLIGAVLMLLIAAAFIVPTIATRRSPDDALSRGQGLPKSLRVEDMSEPVLEIPFEDAFQFDPSPTFAELRESRPVARVRTLAGAEVWLVTRYDDVRMVLADPRFSRAAVVKQGAPRVALAKPMPNSLTTTDPPEHTRLRRLVVPTFAHRKIEQTRPWVAELSAQLADDVAAAGDGADIRQLVALPLPIQVICQLLGVPYADRAQFREWTELGYSMKMAEKDLVEDAMTNLTAYIEDLVTKKLANTDQPAEDLLDELVRAREEGDRLSQEELIAFGVNLLVAGHETSANQISSCVATLLRWPENWAKLVADPSLVPPAIEELLRFNRFSEVGQLRVALEDVELHGVRITAGEGVMAALNSANRDPRAYDAPDELRLDRKDNKHLSFGFGPHFCLGAQLARIELQESLLALVRRFPRMSLAKPAEDLQWRRVLVSGLAELPVNLGN